MKIRYITIFLVLLCCLIGVASAADDASMDIADADIGSSIAVDAISDNIVSDEVSVNDTLSDELDEDSLAVGGGKKAPALSDGEDNPDETIIWVGQNENDGDGSEDNPFKNLTLAWEKANEENKSQVTLNILEGDYELSGNLLFNTSNLIINGIGLVNITPVSGGYFNLISGTSNYTISNIASNGKIFNTDTNVAHGVFDNCTFISTTSFLPYRGLVEYNNCYLQGTGSLFGNPMSNTWNAKFENCSIILPPTLKTLYQMPYRQTTVVTITNCWLGRNALPSYIAPGRGYVTDDRGFWVTTWQAEVNGYAKLAADVNYLGDGQYEILGKLVWDDENNDASMDIFKPMTVQLSCSEGGTIDATAELVNGTFKALYNSTESSHTINLKLNSEDQDLEFRTVDFSLDAPEVYVGDDANVTITFGEDISANITIAVDGTPIEDIEVSENPVIYTIPDLKAGVYEISVTLNDMVNGLVGFNSTNLTVSKKTLDFSPAIPASVKVGEPVEITVEMPEGATGTVSVYLEGDDEPIAEEDASVDTVIPIKDLAAGDYDIIVVYSGNDMYEEVSYDGTLSIEKIGTEIDSDDLVALEGNASLDATLTDEDGEAITGQSIELVIGETVFSAFTDDEGHATFNLDVLAPGEYAAEIQYPGDEYYEEQYYPLTITINKIPVNAIINLVVNYDEVIATVKDLEGNPIANCPITIEITDSEGEVVDEDVETDENGEYSIAANGGDTIVVFYSDENGIVSSSVTISKDLTDLVEGLEDSLNQTQEELDEAKDNISALESQVDELSQNLTEAQKDLDEANAKIDNLTGDLAQAQSDLDDAKADIANLTAQVDDLSEKLNQSEADLEAANVKVGELSTEVTALNDTVESQAALIGDLNDTVNNQTATINDQAEAIDSLNAALDNQTAIIDDLKKKVDELLYIIEGLNKTTELNRTVTQIIYENMTTTSVSSIDGRVGKYFIVKLVDADGKALANMPIGIGFNGKVYDRTTDENGSARLQINLAKKGTYTFAIAYLGDEKYNGSFAVAKIVVTPQTPKLTTSSKTYKASAKTKTLTATFKTVNGNPIKGKKISFTVNGKTYTGTTNANGVASVKVSISKKGTYSFTAKYAGDNIYAAVTKSAKLTIK